MSSKHKSLQPDGNAIKLAAAEKALDFVKSGMVLGLGGGRVMGNAGSRCWGDCLDRWFERF